MLHVGNFNQQGGGPGQGFQNWNQPSGGSGYGNQPQYGGQQGYGNYSIVF